MIELAAIMAAGIAIAATITMGTRYLNSAAEYHEVTAAQIQKEPIVRPHYPSGGEWPEANKT